MAIIEVHGLAKRFGATVALDGVDFVVQPGELVGLIGPNAAGKTTLLRALAGIVRPDAGEPRVCGHPVHPDVVEGRQRLAFVSDQPALFEMLTVMEHLRFVGELYRVPDWRERAPRVLDSLDMADQADAVVTTLSLGYRQRVSLACAFLHEPDAFLLDEPLNGLDPGIRRRLWDLLHAACGRGAAVVLSSHQLELVERVATRFVLLHRGRVRWDGSAEDLRAAGASDAALESVFLRETAGA